MKERKHRNICHMAAKVVISALLVLCMVCGREDVTVCAKTKASESISFLLLSKYSDELDIGDTFYLTAFASCGKRPKYRSSDSKIVSVNSYGRVTAKKGGSADITVKAGDAEAVCRIKVNPTVITLKYTNVSVENGETVLLQGSASSGAKVTYKVNKSSIATVDEYGIVTAKKPGEAIVTAKADGYSKTCRIKVRQPKVTLSKSKINMYRGQSSILSVHISSKVAPTFHSNRSSVAVVDSFGTITAVKNGTAMITVRVDGVSKCCTVVVQKPTIKLKKYEINLKKGQTCQIGAQVSSGNTPEYYSGNTSVAVVQEDGTVKGVGKGKTYVYVSEDGTKVKCRVNVEE